MGVEIQVWDKEDQELGVATLLAMPPQGSKDVVGSVPFPLAVAIAREISDGRREGIIGGCRWLRTA
jgi:hypothetical protein